MAKKRADTHQSQYLQQIEFEPKLWNSPIAKYLTNIRIVLLLVLTILLLGTASYFQLPKRLNPEIQIPIVSVVTPLPGASPEDVESLVTIPLENEIRGISGIDVVTSTSQENVSIITIQFFSSVTPKDAEDDVQSAVDTVTDLPEDAGSPRVEAFDFEDQPVLTFAITSPSNDLPSLMSFSQQLEDRLQEDSRVDRVNMIGFEEQQIIVEVQPDQVAQYGISPMQLAGIVSAAVPSYPAGNVSSGKNAFALTIDPAISSVQDIRNLRINLNGTIVQLGEIATVQQRSALNQRVAFYATPASEPVRAVTFNVFKTRTSNIVDASARVEEIVNEEVAASGNRFAVAKIMNTGEEVDKQFIDLLGEFQTTILLVFGCLFLFLGLRQAVIASITVPLTFLSAFIFMNVLGMSINFLSLFAFLLALGLLVDDSIVIVSAMTTYFRTGRFSPQETGLLVWRDTIVPIWSTTLTTIWSFAPLLLASGIIGEFIKPIPVVVTVTMISSTAIAVLVTLPFMIVLLKPQLATRVIWLLRVIGIIAVIGAVTAALRGNPLLPLILLFFVFSTLVMWRVRSSLLGKLRSSLSSQKWIQKFWQKGKKYSNQGILDLRPVEGAYHRLILRVLQSKTARRRVMLAGVVYTIIAFLLLPLGLVQNEFFPKTDADQLRVVMELPAGTELEQTEPKALEVMNQLQDTPELEFVTAEIGTSFSMDGFGGSSNTSNASTYTLYFGDSEERTISTIEIAELLRDEFSIFPEGEVSIIEPSSGPPAGSDVQIKLLGEDLGQLDQYADQVVEFLETQPGVFNINKSITPGTSAVVFVPDQQKLAQLNLTTQQLALWMRTYASGFTLDTINFTDNGDDELDVVMRLNLSDPQLIELSSILIPTPTGNIPLSSVGYFETKASPVAINREDGRRTLSVSAGVQAGYSISEVNQTLLDYADQLNFTDGYGYDTGGVNEENQRSVQSILQAMLLAFILILVTMVIQFGSYRQAIIVLLVIPLAVSSVFYTFGLTGTPLSFPALIGVLSLFGIVVTNSMFIVDKINLNRNEGMEFEEAIADAGSSRLEPIILTKLCTVFGLLPITLADPLWRGLGGAIISGLLLASTIMLLFIPVVYYSWFKESDKTRR